jgi:hypothetical protein
MILGHLNKNNVLLIMMKVTPQKQLQNQPITNNTVVSSCKKPIPQLAKQLTTLAVLSMSSVLAQQNTERPAIAVPETRNNRQTSASSAMLQQASAEFVHFTTSFYA